MQGFLYSKAYGYYVLIGLFESDSYVMESEGKSYAV